MSALVGKYVKTFAEATHAMPRGMHMNADYPFMMPEVVAVTDDEVTVVGRGGKKATATIRRGRDGEESFQLEQVSSFERMFGRQPTRFTFYPFAGEKR